jgi:hypothetical protein
VSRCPICDGCRTCDECECPVERAPVVLGPRTELDQRMHDVGERASEHLERMLLGDVLESARLSNDWFADMVGLRPDGAGGYELDERPPQTTEDP